MRNGLYAALLAFASATVSTGSAAAHVPARWQHRAVHVTQRAWHPSCGRLRLSFDDPATAHAMFPDGRQANNPAGWAITGVCVIHLDRTRRWLGYPDFCTVVMHEGGNVAGTGTDSFAAGSRSIRYPDRLVSKSVGWINGHRVVHWTGVDRRCLR